MSGAPGLIACGRAAGIRTAWITDAQPAAEADLTLPSVSAFADAVLASDGETGL